MRQAPEIIFTPKSRLLVREVVICCTRLHLNDRSFRQHDAILTLWKSQTNKAYYVVIQRIDTFTESIGRGLNL